MAELEQQTPSTGQLARKIIKAAAGSVRAGGPARVIAFNAATTTCDCQPLVQRTLEDGSTVSDPPLKDVPIIYPGTRSARLRFPLADGDTVWLAFADRSIDEWALSMLAPEGQNPTEIQPDDARQHNISDALAFPIWIPATVLRAQFLAGLIPFDGLSAEIGSAAVKLTPDGKIAIGLSNPLGASVELLDLLDQLIATLQTAQTAAGPFMAAAQASLAAIRVLLATIKGTLP